MLQRGQLGTRGIRECGSREKSKEPILFPSGARI
jgi:hypothetical protein